MMGRIGLVGKKKKLTTGNKKEGREFISQQYYPTPIQLKASLGPPVMSESFNTYESEFQFAIQEAQTKISQINSVDAGM